MKLMLAFFLAGYFASARLLSGEMQNIKRESSPEEVVSELYGQQQNSPFFQTKNRELVNKYFTERLSGLIWKDAVSTPEGEIGALDFDPLYDAQDFDIKNFILREFKYEDGRSEVIASFENIDRKTEIIFMLILTKDGWKIDDIAYSDGRTLVSILGGDVPRGFTPRSNVSIADIQRD